MPSFSRRKKKNRFSRLVADHIQSPKHGGSLVVETGFPTSLIDLYVRNRGRFRNKSAVNDYDKDSEVNSTLTSFSSLSTSENLSSDLDFRDNDEIVIENDVFYDVVSDSCDSNLEVENSGENSDKNVVMLKVFLMIFLALGTKGFVVGFMISALVLFLLEYLGKSLFVRSSLSADPKTLIETGCNENKDVKRLKKENVFNEVLEIKEVNDELKQTIRSEKESDEVVVMEIRQKSSRKAIMKSKMKKLVPKKLLKSMGSKDDLASELKEEESVKRVQDVNKPLVLSHECSYSSNEDLCNLNQEQDKIVEIESCRSSSSTLSSEFDCNVEELGRELKRNSGYLVLCLIVLAGLIGGRVMAVAFSLSWCFILKISQWISCKASQFLI
uniref:uncharacterized protein LOC122607630 n=1 Tax=Erigeron canadensis TaxID=72917 RepID=UPI001CB9D4AD|nr:uncharacterized protein LOC122607630 [Erigeron canadensis]